MQLENIQQQAEGMVGSAPKKGRGKLWKILGGVAVFIIVLVLVVNWAAQGAVRVSDQFIADLQELNAESSYDLFSTKARSAVSSAQWNAVIKQAGPILSGKPKITHKEVSTSTEKGSEATISYEILGSDNITYSIAVSLVKESGTWKVLDFGSKRK